MKLFVVDPHTIYRRGLAACLEALPEVESVGQADSVRSAWEDEALFASDLVIVDHAMTGGLDFVAAVAEATGAPVVVCSSLCSEEAVLAALQAGAVGVLRKETLTHRVARPARSAPPPTARASSRPSCCTSCSTGSRRTATTSPPPPASPTASSRCSR